METSVIMTDRNIQTTLVKFEDITNFQVRRTADADQMNFYDFGFDFSELRYSGSQIKSPLFTLNRFSVMFVFFLKKEVTRYEFRFVENGYLVGLGFINFHL